MHWKENYQGVCVQLSYLSRLIFSCITSSSRSKAISSLALIWSNLSKLLEILEIRCSMVASGMICNTCEVRFYYNSDVQRRYYRFVVHGRYQYQYPNACVYFFSNVVAATLSIPKYMSFQFYLSQTCLILTKYINICSTN